MEIIALQEYTDKYISLYQGQIRNISNQLANRLIEQGIVAEHIHIDKSNSSEDLFIVGFDLQFDRELADTKFTCDKTFDEIKSFFAKYYKPETRTFTKKIIGYAPGSFGAVMDYFYDNSETQSTEIKFCFITPSDNNMLSFTVITINKNGIDSKIYAYNTGVPEEI